MQRSKQQFIEWSEAWRLFEIHKLGPKTLFHGWHGSRVLPLNLPMKAKQGVVTNPGKKLNTFRAGWHVTLSLKDATRYLTRFTANRELCICRVLVRHTRRKPRSTSPIFLAKEMVVLEEDWKKATWRN